MREPKMCQIVCRSSIDGKQAKELKEKIGDEYRVNMYVFYMWYCNAFYMWYCNFDCMIDTGVTWWNFLHRILDNLPLVVPIAWQDRNAIVYQGGYHVGVKGQYAGVSLCAQLIAFVSTVYRSPPFFLSGCSYLIWKYICYRARTRRSLSTTTWHF